MDKLASIDISLVKDLLAYDAKNPLLFNTGLFLLLFMGLMGLYALVRRHRMSRMVLIILFSLYFYYKSSAGYCFILLGVCISDYVIGLALGSSSKVWIRKSLVVLNVVLNVGMLIWFKYFNLLYESFCSITSTRFDPLDIVLPAGISFFCFRSISYIVDIYKGRIEPCRSFLDYTFFLTFFPPLLAGPVVRAKDMLPQIRNSGSATSIMVSEGIFLVMAGLIKKVVVADYISGNFVDRIFDNPSLYSGFENLMGAVGFTIQLYCDFSGYSDMAIGLALLLGFRFKDNFRAPFKAQSPTEFWKRWHISLSTWLMDYIYIPLGGNRKGNARRHANLMTTMVIGGLWHGASWMYVIWGAYNGLLLSLHKTARKIYRAPEWLKGTKVATIGNIMLTFTLVVIGMMFFRARSLEQWWEMSSRIVTDFRPEIILSFIEGYSVILIALAGALIFHFMPSRWTARSISRFSLLPIAIQSVILAIVLFLVIQTRQSDLVPFVYLQY